MSRPRSLSLVLAALVACSLALAACASSPQGTTPPTSTTPTAVGTAAGPIPEVTGAFGTKPTVQIPKQAPADALVVKTVSVGQGPVVQSGDLLVANYAGLTWDDGKEFDSSFDRGSPSAFPIGVGQVIQGWDQALVGQTVGSRVVMAVPPSLGYGSAGKPEAGIGGDDTLVFVVDILGTYPADTQPKAAASATGVDLTGLPQVSGAPGQPPQLNVPAAAKPPKQVKAVVLAEGKGAAITAGSFVIVHYEAVSWENQQLGSTWDQQRPQGVSVGLAAAPSPFDTMVGMTVGTRFLLMVPPNSGGDPQTDTAVAVVDILDSIPPTS